MLTWDFGMKEARDALFADAYRRNVLGVLTGIYIFGR